jgi:hypothetical protein
MPVSGECGALRPSPLLADVRFRLGVDRRRTKPQGRPRFVVYALRYAARTEAGSLPRSLTVNPCWRAQERTSALLGEPADRGELPRFDDAERALVDAAGRAFLAAAGFLLAAFGPFDGLRAPFVSGSLGSC